MNQLVPEVRLPAVLDSAAAGPLVQELRALRGGPISIEAGQVERLGGLCLQALLSARATWAGDRQEFAIHNQPAEMRRVLALCGADALGTMS